jgi:crotonobetainyl-CoA:carnitine CoA-transferase CaiB-like acyl-CoA transferase
VTREHAGLGRVTTTGPAPRLSRTPVTPGRPAPQVGGDALDVLREIGMEDRLPVLSQAQGAM